MWLIHADVWQRPTQYCKAIIFQLKKGKRDNCVTLHVPAPTCSDHQRVNAVTLPIKDGGDNKKSEEWEVPRSPRPLAILKGNWVQITGSLTEAQSCSPRVFLHDSGFSVLLCVPSSPIRNHPCAPSTHFLSLPPADTMFRPKNCCRSQLTLSLQSKLTHFLSNSHGFPIIKL